MNRVVAHKIATRFLLAIRSAEDRGNVKQRKSIVRKFLASRAVHYHYAYGVLGPDCTAGQAAELVARINPFQHCHEQVHWFRFLKKDNVGVRPICSFPAAHTVTHRMIKDVLTSIFRPNTHIYNIWRKGRNVATRELKAALEQGYIYCVREDIRDCFQSVRTDALYSLPLPQSVIRYALDYRYLTHVHDREREDIRISDYEYDDPGVYGTSRNGPRGIMQGSPASNVILAWFLNDLGEAVGNDCLTFLYADDICVASRSVARCREVDHTLARYLAGHRAGPFALHTRRRTLIGSRARNPDDYGMVLREGLEFLGYKFRRDRQNNIQIELSAHNEYWIAHDTWGAGTRDIAMGNWSPIETGRELQRRLSGFPDLTDRASFADVFIHSVQGELDENREAAEEAVMRNFIANLPFLSRERQIQVANFISEGYGDDTYDW